MTGNEHTTTRMIRACLAGLFGSFEAEKLFGLEPHSGFDGDIDLINKMAEAMVLYGPRKFLKNFSRLNTTRTDSKTGFMSEKLQEMNEKELVTHMRRGEEEARKTLRFFGKRTILRLARSLERSENRTMLQGKLDAMLQPKLCQFHRAHKIKDLIKS